MSSPTVPAEGQIAWELDSYFGLSVSRVDPLPHQLEAVYDHLLKLARVRFLLADDAGAGKTIMARLLILDDLTLSDRVRIVSRLRLRTLRGPEQDCGRPDDDRSQNGRD